MHLLPNIFILSCKATAVSLQHVIPCQCSSLKEISSEIELNPFQSLYMTTNLT